jgi:hypothetical protein
MLTMASATAQADGIGRERTGFDQLAHLGADRVHQFHRPALAQHQETGGVPRSSCGVVQPCGGESPGFCTAIDTAPVRAILTMHSRSFACSPV